MRFRIALLVIVAVVACTSPPTPDFPMPRLTPHPTSTQPPPSKQPEPVPYTLPYPEEKQRIVRRCPKVAPYGVPLAYQPWLKADCLKLQEGDRIYETDPIAGSSLKRWIVIARNDPTEPAKTHIVWKIGVGPLSPEPQVVAQFRTTFHIERWVHISDPKATDNVTVQIITAGQIVDTKTFTAPPELDAVDVDYLFDLSQMKTSVTIHVVGTPNVWYDTGTFVVHNPTPDLNGFVSTLISNGRQSRRYGAPDPLALRGTTGGGITFAASSPLGYNDDYDPFCTPHTFAWTFAGMTAIERSRKIERNQNQRRRPPIHAPSTS